MELAVGTVVTGKVTSITKFGAFVSLEGGKSGLVHISEVADSYVNDVRDFLTEGQEVSVKILAVTPEGKINLSARQAQPRQPRTQSRDPHRPRPVRGDTPRSAAAAVRRSAEPPAEPSFEDRLKQFMTLSDSKQSELNRYMQSKRSGKRRK